MKILKIFEKKELFENEKEIEKLTDTNLLILKCSLLIPSREEWIGRTLKFQFLFKEMEKVGLKQSDLIFESYKDIEIPDYEVPLTLKERFIPTELTNIIQESIMEDSDEEDAS